MEGFLDIGLNGLFLSISVKWSEVRPLWSTRSKSMLSSVLIYWPFSTRQVKASRVVQKWRQFEEGNGADWGDKSLHCLRMKEGNEYSIMARLLSQWRQVAHTAIHQAETKTWWRSTRLHVFQPRFWSPDPWPSSVRITQGQPNLASDFVTHLDLSP